MGEKKTGGEKKNGRHGGEKKKDNVITVVSKIDMHWEGCASKIVKTVRGFDGVDAAKAEFSSKKLTVVGEVREMLAEKTKKKVDLVSPQPKKDHKNSDNKKKPNENKKKKNDDKKPKEKVNLAEKTKKVDLVSPQPKKDNKNSDNKNDNKKKPDENKKKKKNDDKKPKEKESTLTTAVPKPRLHCEGGNTKIHKKMRSTKGCNNMAIDWRKERVTVKVTVKERVTVTGTMDMKAPAKSIQKNQGLKHLKLI